MSAHPHAHRGELGKHPPIIDEDGISIVVLGRGEGSDWRRTALALAPVGLKNSVVEPYVGIAIEGFQGQKDGETEKHEKAGQPETALRRARRG